MFRELRSRSLVPALVFSVTLLGCQAPQMEPTDADSFPVLTGEYLGQTPPGEVAELFAPGIITTGMYTRDIAMTPEGDEIYFSILGGGFVAIAFTRLENGRWTEPEIAPFSTDPRYMNIEPHITPDGSRLLFLSGRPRPGIDEGGSQKIWAVDRVGEGWGEPYLLPAPISTEGSEFFPSVTRDGTLYFSRSDPGSRVNYLYRSRLVDGEYTEPELLPEQVNGGTNRYNAFVAPDESYMIVPMEGHPEGIGGTDYFIVFRSEDDVWSEPINLGEAINTEGGQEFSPYVSPDGRYFFFMASRPNWDVMAPGDRLSLSGIREMFNQPENGYPDIYWIDASFLESLRPSDMD